MNDPTPDPLLTVAALRDRLAAGTLTARDIIEDVYTRLDAPYADPAVWIERVPREHALARAAELDALGDGARDLPLFGIPFAVKDNIDVGGMPTTAGCPAYAYHPTESAPVVRKLLEAGAILIGKTNLDQFATGSSGPVRHTARRAASSMPTTSRGGPAPGRRSRPPLDPHTRPSAYP